MLAYENNDHAVRLTGASALNLATGLASALTGTALVQFRVQDADYVDVVGETWPQTMMYIAGSLGDFIGVLRNEVVLQVGATYHFIATVDAGPDQYAEWDIPLPVLTRH